MGTDVKNRLRMYRVGAGLTQEELAMKVEVTRQTIGLIEAGKYNPSLNLCISICKTLGVSLNKIFWMEEDEDV